MPIEKLSSNFAVQQNPPQGKNKKGPADLAKALGITEQELKKMSPEDVEKLAKEKGVDLNDYPRPDNNRPPKQPPRPIFQ